ncbi:MAG: hypothetical protein GY937_02365 [bacterium]|nr:hypothetical protein [bacterium]
MVGDEQAAIHRWTVVLAAGQFETPGTALRAVIASVVGRSGLVTGPEESPDGALVLLVPTSLRTREQVERKLRDDGIEAEVLPPQPERT